MAKIHSHEISDTHQSIWQLASIQLSGWMSLPILATSVLILQENSFYGAALTIIVANAILWFIRLGIVVMSNKKRQSTLDISRDYLGDLGAYFIGALLLISTLAWFIAQTTAASNTLTHLVSISETPEVDKFIQMSILIGVTSTFLCMEGVALLKKISTFVFPILIVLFGIIIYLLPFRLPLQENAVFSLSGLTLVLATHLGITSDLPTFFRHSRSIRTSIVALTIIQLISLALSLFGLYLGAIITGPFEMSETVILGSNSNMLRIALSLFVFLSVICANVANVYSASVGWEVIAPSALVGRKEYLILGLILTIVFILISNFVSVEFLLHNSDYSLVNLCMVLILGYIISQIVKRPPSPLNRHTYFIAWLLSTIGSVLQFEKVIPSEISPLLVSIIIILSVVALSNINSILRSKTQQKNTKIG
jgi:cytosine permease